MTCKITDQVIMDVQDGKPIRYSSYKKDVKIGDSFTLKYFALQNSIKITLKHLSKEYIDSSIIAEKGLGADSKEVHFRNNVDSTLKYWYNRISIFLNKISYQNYNILDGKLLEMNRYYKSDWDANLTGIYVKQTQILTLDCRGISDKIDEIIERYKTYPGDYTYKK
jgi:hypothetical protein